METFTYKVVKLDFSIHVCENFVLEVLRHHKQRFALVIPPAHDFINHHLSNISCLNTRQEGVSVRFLIGLV
jgi:hypothetical protein